jgi:alanine dehydrogenase
MRIGIPREIKPGERRIALTPAAVRELVSHRHTVMVEAGAGLGAGFADTEFEANGAEIRPLEELWAEAELLVKVKEPQEVEAEFLGEGQTLFGYLHLAPNPHLTDALVRSGVTALAFETVTDVDGHLPLLAPMSEVAGRLAIQFGAMHLLAENGGRGLLAGGVPGVRPATAVIIGGGVVGENAARVAIGMGFETVCLDRRVARLRELDSEFQGRLRTVASTQQALEDELVGADLVIGAVLAPGALAPKLIQRHHLGMLGAGAVFVDVAIDQGGCAETSQPTTHGNPTFVVDGVVHNCVANLPGAVPRTSTHALSNAILPYVVALADRGVDAALAEDPGLAKGLNVAGREITHPGVAEAFAGATA